jgi:NAD(P)-dependent dehydrogenase (short-subunit alcohol dehydrogenase family)
MKILLFCKARIYHSSFKKVATFVASALNTFTPDFLRKEKKLTIMALLAEKVAIVTGAGSGIGRSIAEFYAREGAKVIVSDVDDKGGQQTVDLIREAGGEASYLHADVSKVEDNKKLVETAVERYGALHIACNNAGIGGDQGPLAEMSPDNWDKVIAVNLSSAFYGMRYQIPAILEAGGGAIVNIASILGQVGFQGAGAYVASKHGMVGLTKNAALEYSEAGVRVNAVGPGFIQTPMIEENLTDEQVDMVRQLHPIGRLGKPEEVAELVLWLSSDKASFVTGSYYAVDGAYLAQ